MFTAILVVVKNKMSSVHSRTTASGNSYFCNGCNAETEDVVELKE